MKILTENSDGFAISELDLKMRGSGQLVGTRQHGVSDFEFTDLARDIDIIISAKKEAEEALIHHSENALCNNAYLSELTKGIRSKRILSILS